MYCKSESILKETNPEDLSAFSNKLFMEEVRVHLPIWNACVRGTCGLKLDERPAFSMNAIALATATIARYAEICICQLWLTRFHQFSSTWGQILKIKFVSTALEFVCLLSIWCNFRRKWGRTSTLKFFFGKEMPKKAIHFMFSGRRSGPPICL